MLEGPILHVLVVGFHHKKGCQVEYAYPLLSDVASDSMELPDAWKHLPSLALPDGAHNYEQDTIYFHLPSLTNPQQTIYGISCYRQMNAEKLLNKSSDITRGSVQKSVCVLSTLPLYGLIKAKLELITHAYFDERDFSKVSLLEETYKNLNSSLSRDMVGGTQGFLGLNVRDVILHFKHKAVLLFKLLLLERKVWYPFGLVFILCSVLLMVLFCKSPVEDLCGVILSVCSLFPGMIERGLIEAACSVTNRHNIPDLIISNEDDDYVEVYYTRNHNESELDKTCETISMNVKVEECQEKVMQEKTRTSTSNNELDNNSTVSIPSNDNSSIFKKDSEQETSTWHVTFDEEDQLLNEIDAVLCTGDAGDAKNNQSLGIANKHNTSSIINTETSVDTLQKNSICLQKKESNEQITKETISDKNIIRPDNENGSDSEISHSGTIGSNQTKVSSYLQIETDDYGFPLAIFTKGSLCHPYLSLPYLDLLSNINTRSFVVGATNVLFKQKKYLFDVIVEIDEAKVDIMDDVLRNNLHLTTEDLRFADHLVRHVTEDTQDVFLDGTGWEGGDEWLRGQFRLYLLSLLRTSELDADGHKKRKYLIQPQEGASAQYKRVTPRGTITFVQGAEVNADSKEYEAFNTSFMTAWKTTHNYKMWNSEKHQGIFDINPGHPFHGQISVADMRLRIFHTMQGSERGRKFNQVVASTGKVVSQTGKAFGGAFTTAKSAVSSWWSNLGSGSQSQNQSSRESFESYSESPN